MSTSSVFLAKKGLFVMISSEGFSLRVNATMKRKRTFSFVSRASKPKEVNCLLTAPFLDIGRHFITMATVTPRRQPARATLQLSLNTRKSFGVVFFLLKFQTPVTLCSGELWSILVVRVANSADQRSLPRHVSSEQSVAYSTGCSRLVTQPGTNPARRCLTSVI